MKKNKTTWLIIIFIAVIAVTFIMVKNRTNSNPGNGFSFTDDGQPSSTGSAPGNTGGSSVNGNTVLKRGSRNEYVKKLQRLMNVYNKKVGKAFIAEDGIFGTQTETILFHITGKREISYNQAYSIAKSKLANVGQDINSLL